MCEVAKKKEMNWFRKVSILTAETHKMSFWSRNPARPEQVSLTATSANESEKPFVVLIHNRFVSSFTFQTA